jgi:hypothetical protein
VLGADTDEVLRTKLGLGDDELEALHVQGVVCTPACPIHRPEAPVIT